jgi:sigma-54 dependent transcriptional regulator, acetoin dehydrogenase operon transcriptional activator AcoR
MSRGARLRPGVTDDRRLARARERFLTAEPVEPGQVRDTILASLRRSRAWHVAADRIDLSYVRDPDLDTPLTRAALPVLQNLRENLQGQPVSVILTDAHGVALSRLTADRDLERHLDRVQLAPGFSYAEEFVGTNGIGTALESGQAAHVFGHEHYAEHLEDLACAAVPIRHPVSGQAIGAVNLTCWRKDAGRLLIALAHSTGGQVTQGLLDDSSAEEFQLLQEYLRACRHTGGLVFALTSDMMLMNDQARDTLDPGDQAALLGHAAQALAGGHPAVVDVELPTGARARMHCRPLRGKGRRRIAGGVVHVKLIEPASQAAADAGADSQAWRYGLRPAVAARLPSGGSGPRLGRVALGAGRTRNRQAGAAAGRRPAPQPGRRVPRAGRRRRRRSRLDGAGARRAA